ERRLIDDVGAVAHRRERRLDAVGAGRSANLDDAELLRAQVAQVRGLVLAAAFGQEIDDRVVAPRPARAPFGYGEIELAQVSAAQVIREVGRGEPQQFGNETHRAMIVADRRGGYRYMGGLRTKIPAKCAPSIYRVCGRSYAFGAGSDLSKAFPANTNANEMTTETIAPGSAVARICAAIPAIIAERSLGLATGAG